MEESGPGGGGVDPRNGKGWTEAGPLEAPPRSVLIVMLSAVGDSVQVLPVLSALRRTFPCTFIAWVLQPGPASLVAGHPAVDRIVIFERGPKGRRPGAVAAGLSELGKTAGLLRRLAREQPGGRFDLILCLQVYLKAGLLTALTPGEVKLGFDMKRSRDLNWLFTTHRIPPHPRGAGHIQDQYFEFLHYLGVDPEPVEYGLAIFPVERADQRAFFSSLDRPVCAVVTGTSNPRKDWDPDRYVQVISALDRDLGLQPVLVGGRSPGEQAAARHILSHKGGIVVDARGGGLRRLAWLLEGSALVITPDTGPLHIARALEVPVVGLFGFTNPKRSGPYRRFSDLIVDGYARHPGEDYPIARKTRAGGMNRITPSMVLEKVEKALRHYKR